ncbi:MAG: acetate kinase [Treponemataceae bacterium]|nr:MAG: acetate kinase [Treponemataceae bacterium]
MVILTLNCGSSSVKYQVYDWENKDVLASGEVERVTMDGSMITQKVRGRENFTKNSPCPTHKEAVELIIGTISDSRSGVISDMSVIKAVGHRLVHGGDVFTKSVIVTDEVIKTFDELSDLAPLHNPANIVGIRAAKKVLPDVPHCAIMDTAWHQTMEASSYMYALPYEWFEKYGVRRYGFHGTSFLYTAKRAAVLLKRDALKVNVIVAHIGNGASICAIKNGVSIDTSMGLTPLEGLVMGTRSGDIDPAIPFYVMRKSGMSAAEVETALNKKSGVLGVTQEFVDRRDVEKAAAAGNEKAQLVKDIECTRVKKYIGAYAAELGKVDALVFTGGVGEFQQKFRRQVCEGLEIFGIKMDSAKNEIPSTRNAETCVSADDSPVKIFVIPTDEELVMTEDAYALMAGTYDVHTKFTYSFQSAAYVNKAREDGLKKDIEKNPALANVLARNLL